MAIENSDFLLIHRNGENYKAPVSDLQLDLESDLDFAPTDHNHDSDYLKLSGGALTGNLLSDSLFKTTRDEGYAFQVRPNNGETSAYIHTSGHAIFSDRVEVDGKKVSLEDHVHSSYAEKNHNHDASYVKGNYTITKSGGNYYIS